MIMRPATRAHYLAHGHCSRTQHGKGTLTSHARGARGKFFRMFNRACIIELCVVVSHTALVHLQYCDVRYDGNIGFVVSMREAKLRVERSPNPETDLVAPCHVVILLVQ